RHLRRLSESPRLLDVGCGNGGFGAQMRAFGWRGLGVDIDSKALERARAAGVPVRQTTIEQLDPTEVGEFDAVTFDHVIEHIPEPVSLLRHAFRLLRPGGLVWIGTPNLEAASHRYFR